MQNIALEGYLLSIQIIDEEYILTEGLMDSLKNGSDKIINNLKNLLKKYKINIDSLKPLGLKFYNKITKGFEAGVPPEELSKELTKEMKAEVKRHLYKAKEYMEDQSLFVKIILALVLTILVVGIVQTLVMFATHHILLSAFKDVTVKIAYSIIIGVLGAVPEELLKAIFIKLGMPWSGTLTFAIAEMFGYLMSGVASGTFSIGLVIGRLVGVFVHMFTTFVQKKIVDSAENEDDVTRKRLIAYVVGVLIHFSWNFMAVFMAFGNPDVGEEAKKTGMTLFKDFVKNMNAGQALGKFMNFDFSK